MENLINFLKQYKKWLNSSDPCSIELPDSEQTKKMLKQVKALDQLINKTDWTLFAEQKTSLVNAADYFDREAPEQQDHFNGLLSFIDALQDCFVDDLGYPEEKIFPTLTDF